MLFASLVIPRLAACGVSDSRIISFFCLKKIKNECSQKLYILEFLPNSYKMSKNSVCYSKSA